MKKLTITIFILFLTLAGMCQDSLTLGEIYDFEVGDKFQTHGTASDQPPNADRITIMDKWYSASNDTVFYEEYHDDYLSSLSSGWPPVLTYGGNIFTDTVAYTNLTTDLMNSEFWVECDSSFDWCDTIHELSAEYCDSVIFGQNYAQYPVSHEYFFGKGLGLVFSYTGFADGGNGYGSELFYYEKNGLGCGTPDNKVVSIEEISASTDVSLSPNPADDYFTIHTDVAGPFTVEVFTITGKRMSGQTFSSSVFEVDCSALNSGIYIVVVTTSKKKYIRKLVKC